MPTQSHTRQPAKNGPVLFARQRQLLALLNSQGGAAVNLDFQKLLFLYCQEPASDRPYDFVPYKFGAFSFTSYADRRKLIERGLLVNDDHHWQLTDEGRSAIGKNVDALLNDFALRYRTLRGDALVADTYRRFPYYATRSEIAERVLRGDRDALAQIDSVRRTPSAPALQTIGYEGHSLESYLNVLLRAGVTLLCDVRKNPISRKYGFSKGTLSRACEGVGVRYEHLPQLGIVSEKRRELETQADYDALFRDYERTGLPKQTEAVGRIARWVKDGERVALTCYENLPHQCHRHCVAKALEQRLGKNFLVNHL